MQAFPISKPGCTIFHFKLADSFTREEDTNTVVDCALFVRVFFHSSVLENPLTQWMRYFTFRTCPCFKSLIDCPFRTLELSLITQ